MSVASSSSSGAVGPLQGTLGRALPGPSGSQGMAAISRYCSLVKVLALVVVVVVMVAVVASRDVVIEFDGVVPTGAS